MSLLLLTTAQGSWLTVGSISTGKDTNSVALDGSYAYVAGGFDDLQIIDVSTPTNPSLKSSCGTPGIAKGVAVSGSYAYVADYDSGLQIIDINTPSSPSRVGYYDTPGYAYSVAVSGSYAYVADDSSLQIIDVSDSIKPTIAGFCDTPSNARGVAVSGSYAFVADGDNGLQIIDVITPTSPSLKGSCDTPGVADGVAVSGSYAYVADDSSLQIIDVSDPIHPFLKGSCNTPANGVAVSGSYAYVSSRAGSGALQIIDVSDPSSPSIVGSCNTQDSAFGVAHSGGLTYVAAYSVLQIIAEGATLQGKAWRDLNGDGLQDMDEPDEANVAVQLLDSGGSPISGRSATTGSDGSYSFTDLVPGSYYVQFTQPTGKSFSPKDQGADDSIDSDVNSAGRSDKITLDPSQSKSADAGLYQNPTVINEIYPNPVGSDNQAGTVSWERVELKNVGSVPFNVGGWTIKDDDSSPLLATIPVGTTIPAGGYLVLHIGDSSHGISNGNGDPVILSNFDGIEVDRVACPIPSDYEGLSYSCIPDASENWNFWGEPTFGGDLSQSSLPGAPNMVEMDYGDAPDTFKTLRASDGARHFVTGPYLGSSVDSESDGQPTANADGDGADEDGATFSDHIIIGQQSTFSVTASASGILQAWMDFNRDGDFSDAGEQIAADRALSAGAQTVSFSVPADAKEGYTFSRLRFSSLTGLASYGPASDGEVEDYRVEIKYGLGDYVWVDEDVDGIQDADEKGLEGVTVNLMDAADNIVASQTTDADGKYLFESPAPGAYYLEFLPPAGYSITVQDQGADNGLDSDADPVTHRTGKVNVVSGSTDLSWDAGLYQPVSISGMKFHDKDANGEKGPDEPPISGWEIQLKDESDNLLQTTTTSGEPGKEGTYEFVDLHPGTYRVYEAAKNGWVRTSPAEEYFTVTLTNMPAWGKNFGNNQLAISGLKFHDKNADGKMDADEPPISGWEIQLKDESDKILKSTTTSAEPGKEGTYKFLDLQPDTYRVYEIPKNGWVRTYPAGEYHTVTLINMPSRGNMFGNNQLAISGLKFHDKNADGKMDADEPPISGWEMQLTDESDRLLQTTTTSGEPGKEGVYEFVDLQPGTYRVYEAAKNGWVRTYPAEEYHTVTLINMPSRGNIFGNNQLAISGLKFHDKNANGQKDADEPPLSGWEMQLKDESDNLLQTTTTSGEPGKEGVYEFVDLQPGTYRVYEAAKNGWVRTYPAEEYHAVTLTNQPSRGNMFGNVIASGFSGMKFEDLNGNGAKDSGEPGLSGWTINLVKEGTTVASHVTATDGTYSFVDVAPGSYTVTEAVRPGWTQSYPATTGTYPVTLVSGVPGPTNLDFGNFRATGFSGMKFEDLNGNGAKDAGEPGLSGWTIRLMKEGTEVESQVTAADGTYSFTSISPGSYTVEEAAQAGWTQSYPSTSDSYPVTLVSGVPGPTNLDFGNYRSTGFSGMKFDDKNGNGAKDSGEQGLSGWTIKLVKDGTEVDSTVTAADGTYSFTGISPGSYTVEEAAQSGWTQSYPASGTHPLNLVSGVPGPTNLDFGNYWSTSLSGMKFEDKNSNGLKDSGEPGLAGWTIRLLKEGAEVDSTVTAVDGSYSFTGVVPGSYTVEEVAQAGWTQTCPAAPGTHAMTLVSGAPGPTNLDFGNYWSTSLSGMKFEDKNGNGAKDSGEPGLSGWTIRLMKEGTEVDSTITAADGAYSFVGISPGSFTVEEVAQSGWTQTCPAAPGTHTITLVSGVPGPTNLDFGNYWSTSLSGMKFEDKNGNGAKDSGEPGLSGWTIRLMKEGTEVDSTVTAADGTYSFIGISPGSCTVEEVAQLGWTQTYPATPETHAITLVSGVPGPTNLDFGNRRFVQALQVAITADNLNVLPGQKLTFYITINHDSSIGLNSMIVEYTLPSGLSFIDSNYSPLSVTQNADGTTTITWKFSAFSPQMASQIAESAKSGDANAPLATITVNSEVLPDAPESLTGRVVVTGDSGEATIAQARDTVSVNVEKPTGQPIRLNKTSDLKEVWPGATIGYTITYESLLKKTDLTEVVITEQASPDLIFLSASPAPDQGADNVWSIGDLAPGEKGTISVLFQVKNASNLSFLSQSSVYGSGFASTYRRLSTETESQSLRNSVTLTCKEFTPVSTSYFVKLRNSDGTSLFQTEHGSGEYQSEELASLQMQNRSISTAGSLKAVYRPTSFSLPGGRSINYSSEISSLTRARNRATQASTSQAVRYAKSLEMDEKLLIDKNETLVSVEGSLQGQAHLGTRKKDSQAVNPATIFESSQAYTGSFRFNSSLEDYGGNLRLIGNASGQGEVASDQRLKKSQRSYEHGNGSYESEQQASTAESYLAKDLSVSHDAQYSYGKWQSGIWSKSSGKSYLGQQISGADFIKEETKASGLNDLSSNLSYRGQGRFRTISEPDNRSTLDLDEEYVGEYTIQRKVRLGGVSRFDRPHLTLNKTGWREPGTAAADYTITIQNDGNTALGPIYVWDIFPAGTDYLGSSLKPARLQPGYANWSLLYLGIGQSVTINLRLNVTEPQDELVNLVYASGGHNDEWVTAGNMSVIGFGWQNCCEPGLFMEKQARVDSADSRVIWYRILLQNRANVSLVAQVTDRLPAGLRLLNASAEPQVVGPDLVWVTTAIPAGESRFIEYRAQASQDGRFVNTALAEAHALDGSGWAMKQASATVTIGQATSYSEDGWRPPEWGLDRMEMICDDEIAGDGDGCGSCPSCSCPVEE